MSSALNVITASFGGLREVATSPLWQWDYGQILKIKGLDLPQAFEVHFSNSRKSGETVTQIGTDSQVVIPDMYLTSGADIYAFVFLHDGTDDGETEYVIKIPVRERPEPSDIEPTPEQQDVITEAIAALNAAVAQCGAYVEHYPTVVDGYWYVWDEASEQFVTTGVPATGNGIASARLNQDYTLTLVFTDGTSFTTPISIRGEKGEPGAKGDPGAKGEPGATGNGIASIAKTATVGLVDTYTITFTDGTTTTFDVTNGAEAIDATLSIAGRAADAKATGDEIGNLKSDLTVIEDVSNCEFISITIGTECGGIHTDGYNTPNDTRARTIYSAPVNLASPVVVYPKDTKHRVIYYNGYNNIMLYMSDWSTMTEDPIIYPDIIGHHDMPLKFRILIGYTDNRIITADNLPIPKIEYFYDKNDGVPFVNGYYPQYNSPPSIRGYNTAYNMSAILPVEPSTTYRANKFRVTLTFDDQLHYKRVIAPADLSNNLLTTASDEYYVVYCWKPTDCEKAYFEKADAYVSGAEVKNLVPVTLKGKYLSLLGDSISAYAGTIPSGNDVYYTGTNSGVDSSSQMWWSVLCDELGMIPLVINGYSGSAVTQLEDSAHVSKIPMSSDERCSGLSDGTNTPDVIVIAGGVNDYSYAQSAQSEPLEWDGLTAPVLGNSFTEAYACMIKKLQTNYPNAIIVCLSTWFTMRGDDNGYTLTHTVGNNKYTQTDYNNAIKHVAEQMHVPFIDVSNIGFNRNNFYPTYAEDSSTIPTHPNASGQGVMGRAIAKKLPDLVKAYLT